MSDTTDLIRRARELAKLADVSTKGPYRASAMVTENSPPPKITTEDGKYLIATLRPYITLGGDFVCNRDADLLAASWDMARLLGQLADELERLGQITGEGQRCAER